MNSLHPSVLPEKVLEYLVPEKSDAIIVDGTLGDGGHAQLFLEKFPKAKVIGIDIDLVLGERACKRLKSYKGRFEFRNGWTDQIMASWNESAPDLVLMDLGISSYHYKERGLGFSFNGTGPLDMRLDANSDKKATDFVNKMTQVELADLIYRYGEERYSRSIARKIVECRKEHVIEDSGELARIVTSALPFKARRGQLHPATRTFQALRIAVNRELERLAHLLEVVPALLAPKGKFGVISFHSLEDRLVKQAFRKYNRKFGGDFEILTPKPVVADQKEAQENPSARSAKLRVIEKPVEEVQL